jgi:hypothetical protein
VSKRDDEIELALEQFVAEAQILSPAPDSQFMRSAYDNHPVALDVWHALEALRAIRVRREL